MIAFSFVTRAGCAIVLGMRVFMLSWTGCVSFHVCHIRKPGRVLATIPRGYIPYHDTRPTVRNVTDFPFRVRIS